MPIRFQGLVRLRAVRAQGVSFMEMVTVSCPSCGFNKSVPRSAIPAGATHVNCPRCKTRFAWEASSAAASPVPPAPPRPAAAPSVAPGIPVRKPAPPKPEPAGNEMVGVEELFRLAWDTFKQRWGTLLGLFLLTPLMALIPAGIFFGACHLLASALPASRTVLLAVGGIGAVTMALVAYSWGFGALICATVDDEADLRRALAEGKRLLWPYVWVSTLLGIIIGGGFLLAVIPGIIFSVWFFFAPLILFAEGTGGMDAVLKSREYVRGHWFDVFVRLLIIWGLSGLLGLIPVVGPIVSILLAPFVMLVQALIYRDLRRVKGDVPYPCGSRDKAVWVGIGIMGYVVVLGVGGYLVAKSPLLQMLKQGKAGAGLMVPVPANPGGEAGTISFGDGPSGNRPSSPESVSAALADQELADCMLYVYALDYTGTVKVNGEERYVIKGERSMNYNYTGSAGLKRGENTVTVDYQTLPDTSLREIKVKLYRYDWDTKQENVISEWSLNDEGGSRSFTVQVE